MEKNHVYVCYLCGEGIFGGHSNEGVLTSLDDIDKLREILKDKYHLEFDWIRNLNYSDGYIASCLNRTDVKLVIDVVDIIK